MTATLVFALGTMFFFGPCQFDNHAKKGDYVVPSIIEAGYCHDVGRNYGESESDWIGCVAQTHEKEPASPCTLELLKEASAIGDPDSDSGAKNL